MPFKPKAFRPAGVPTPQENRKQRDQQRGTASARGYTQLRWEVIRKRVALRDLYVCQACGADVGEMKGDFVCDHIVARKRGEAFDPLGVDRDENLQTLCFSCHSRKTRREAGHPPTHRR